MKKSVITILVIALITVTAIVTIFRYRTKQKPLLPESPRERAIEGTGLVEFSPGLVEIEITSPADRAKYEKMAAIFSALGDGKDPLKNTQAVGQLDRFIKQYPDTSDAYFMRATLAFSAPNPDYAKILKDLSKTEQLVSSAAAKNPTITAANIYIMRAKVHLLANNDQQAIADLESAIKSDPSRSIFNNGGVKPEEETPERAAMQNRDFEYLVSKYPNDFRVYMARGLFYDSFTAYSESYFSPALLDLNRALALKPDSALVEYLLGSLYQQTTFWTRAAARDISDSGGYRDQQNENALQHIERATAIDPKFTEAWAQQAEILYSLKQFKSAIPYYDKVIELDPTRWGAYNDRGMAKSYSNDYYGAVSDFTEALNVKKQNHIPNTALDPTYESRGDAYLKTQNYEAAAADYGRAIGVKFSSAVFLMSLTQIRGVYPELQAISDADLLEGLRQKYYPNMSASDFVGQYQKNTKPYDEFVLAGLYENRGDVYWRSKKFRRAVNEYNRARHMDRSFILDRWKSISKSTEKELFIDTQTIDFAGGNAVSLWVKTTMRGSAAYSEEKYQIDCASRKMKLMGFVNYDSLGNPRTSRDSEKDWELIVPESMGEQLANGACQR
jgi:tetratricopeptide (TPR) repeat protein